MSYLCKAFAMIKGKNHMKINAEEEMSKVCPICLQGFRSYVVPNRF